MRRLVVTAGFDGYTRPYRAALGTEQYDYTCIMNAREVSSVDWEQVAAVVFTGGADISPAFYGREAASGTYTNPQHDELDRAVLDAVRHKPIKKFGTCRGAQLLWADEGAQVVQHIPHHGRDHPAAVIPRRGPSVIQRVRQDMGRMLTTDEVADALAEHEETTGPEMEFEITSLHHQACIWDSWEARRDSPPPILMLVGDAQGQSAVEAWSLPAHGCYGFQYHPEWMADNTPGYAWTIGAIQRAVGIEVDNGYVYPRLNITRSDLHDEST